MKILFIGDIYGRSGREALEAHLPRLKTKYQPDFLIINGENAAHGRGITSKICGQLYDLGADCITTGNHVFSQKETLFFIGDDPNLLRPLNYPEQTPGNGYGVFTTSAGKKVLVANLMGRIYMDVLDNPFRVADALLDRYKLGKDVDAIFIDFHAEATSEKCAFGHYMDGRVSAVIGTHTHIPTADTVILDGGTAYQTDAGMTGDYNSVIGADKDVPVQRFVRGYAANHMSPAGDTGSVCGTLIETDDATGLAKAISPIRIGGRLPSTEND